jgi:mono/diheme cytochrome c family protein
MKGKPVVWTLEALALVVVLAGVIVGWLGGRPLSRTWDVEVAPIAIPKDSTSIAEGARLARIEGCRACHDDGLTGGFAFADDLLLGRVVTANLTRVLPAYSDLELVRLLRYGVRRDGTSAVVMPSEMFVHLSDEDLGKLIAWLRTVPPVGETHRNRTIGLMGRFRILTGDYVPSAELVPADASWPETRPDPSDPDAFGRYLAMTACSECHGQDLGGLERAGAPDLAMAAAYSPEQFRHLLRTGEGLGGRDLGLMSIVSPLRFGALTDAEIDALHAWLVARTRR